VLHYISHNYMRCSFLTL